MMDTASLTTEERIALLQLVQSPGWAFLMERLFIPEIQHITQQLDRSRSDQAGYGDMLRGEKRVMMRHLDFVYAASGIPNPLEVHALGLLKAVARTRDEATPIPVLHAASLRGDSLCGKKDEPIVKTPDAPTCVVCQQLLSVRAHRGRNAFPV